MAACQTGSTYISAGRQDRNEIPTATPPFPRSRSSGKLMRILWDATGRWNSKIAAAKPEVPISLLVDKIETKFQWLPPIFEVQQPSGTNGDTVASDILLKNFYVR